MSDTYFPIQFLAAGKFDHAGGTSPGIYLRWLVKPYLGIPGISPYHPDDLSPQRWAECGFRLFYTDRFDDSQTVTPLPLGPLMPVKPAFGVSEVYGKPGWRACYAAAGTPISLNIDLIALQLPNLRYLRFNYRVFADQKIWLEYTILEGQTGNLARHRIPLHYPDLSDDLKRLPPISEFERRSADLTYAIHVDSAADAIHSLTFNTTGTLMLGDFYSAGPAGAQYYAWTPPGGDRFWSEVPTTDYAVRTLNDPLIRPAPGATLLAALKDFYGFYYGSRPAAQDADRITFIHPDPPQIRLRDRLVRDYLVNQYEQLCRGQMDAGLPAGAPQSFQMRPQDAAALAASDPAIAFVSGLFRILNPDSWAVRRRQYKIQGQWPDQKRFCIWFVHDPSLKLSPPQIGPITARAIDAQRTLRDYRTFRVHHPIQCTELAWDVMSAQAAPGRVQLDPIAYLILCGRGGGPPFTALSPFHMPRDEESGGGTSGGEVRFLDWYEMYSGSDIPKVLDGQSLYMVAGFDIFGQMSDFQQKDGSVKQNCLPLGDIRLPAVSLHDSGGAFLNLPLEVIKTATGYRRQQDQSEYLHLKYSFFWPLESRAIWDRNRATGAVSLDSFRAYYLVETPLSVQVTAKIISNGPQGLAVQLEGVYPATPLGAQKNSALYQLVRRLDGTDPAGKIEPAFAQAVLTGGRLEIGREFKILSMNFSPNTGTLTLYLCPSRDETPDQFEVQGKVTLVLDSERLNTEQRAQLYWNTEATYGGVRVGWKLIEGATSIPSPWLDYHAQLAIQNQTPANPPVTPADLPSTVGLLAHPIPAGGGKFQFTISLPAGHPLFDLERFLFTPLDPASGLEPGEYPSQALPTDSPECPPAGADPLFSTERIVTFLLTRQLPSDTQPGTALFRGEPVIHTSRAANPGGQVSEFLVFPNQAHSHWRIIPPNTVSFDIPLSEILGNGSLQPVKSFSNDNTLATRLHVAVEAVAGADPEVISTLQSVIAEQKLLFQEILAAPDFKTADVAQPDFGITAGKPGYDGVSLIALRKVFAGYDLETLLPAGYKYLLYCLPSDRVFFLQTSAATQDRLPVEYAFDNVSGMYRRNLLALKECLNEIKSGIPQSKDYFDADALQRLFQEFAEKITQQPLDKTSFFNLPVTLPGESRTVFLFAIKAYSDSVQKEADRFTCLSAPVYVEDATSPGPPKGVSLNLLRDGNDLQIQAVLARALSKIDGHGYVSPSELTGAPDLLGACLPCFAATYRVYITNDITVAGNPDESDFFTVATPSQTIGAGASSPLCRFSLKLMPQTLSITLDDDRIQLDGRIHFAPSYDLGEISEEAYVCLRTINYLDEMSPLTFTRARIVG